MNSIKLRHSLLLLLTAIVWGTSFVAQNIGADYLKPFTYNGVRFIMGGLVLLPLVLIRTRKNPELRAAAADPDARRMVRIASLVCSVCLFSASSLQQASIQYTTAGKCGFITAFYIILVPVISLFLGRKNSPIIWISTGIAVIGLYLISIKNGFHMEKGDFLALLCALVYAFHILAIDYFGSSVDGIELSCFQFFLTGLFSIAGILLFERQTFSVPALLLAWKPLCYSGILSAGVGYTLQAVAQKGLNPVVASLIMCLESPISAISGWIILQQAMTPRELLGCALMLAAVVMSEVLPTVSKPDRNRRSRTSASG